MSRRTSSPSSLLNDAALGGGYVDSITLLRQKIKKADKLSYPFDIPSVQHLGKLPLHPAVTYLVGENGSGKSTLLEAIAVRLGFSAEGGTRNYSFSTQDTHSSLHQYLRVTRCPRRADDHFFLRAESFYSLMNQVDDYERLAAMPYQSWGGLPPHQRSHGEAFLTLLTQKLRGKGLYLFDEPEAALSTKRQMAALVRIHDLVQKRSQFIIATHSPVLLAYPHCVIYECGAEGLREVKYQETEVYRTTRDFMLHHERWVAGLLNEEQGG